ncbi:hypothetical protein [uncultured Desulfosarcina sp.]|uniref:hypothetical protein n=1 Tax=uncultured Desulfosarcina sp. TaxID=218289 RepID=UPI0029C6FD1D|nr:hypothetical protein [uncultured Desulfosarcina sp.]
MIAPAVKTLLAAEVAALPESNRLVVCKQMTVFSPGAGRCPPSPGDRQAERENLSGRG